MNPQNEGGEKPAPEDQTAQSTDPSPASAPVPVGAPAPEPPAPAPEPQDAPEGDPEAPYGRKADGTPRAKPGRKSATAQTDEEGAVRRAKLESVTPAPPRTPKAPSMAPIVPVDYKALGQVAANLWFNVGQLPFGPEWAPDIAEGEHEIVAGAFRDYFKAKNVTQIDPTVGLVIVLGGYALKRAARPTIKEKISAGWTWLKSKMPKKR